MPIPMPSPRGTNYERAFLPSGSRAAAYDAAPDDTNDPRALLTMILAKLGPEDKALLRQMLDEEQTVAATDSAGRTYLDRRFAAGHISGSEYTRLKAAGLTGAPPLPRETRSFDEMFPDAARLWR